MIGGELVAIAIALSLAAAACERGAAPTPPAAPSASAATFAPSMKGWELYAWQEGDAFYYSLLVGTNAEKRWAQIATPADDARGATRLAGSQALEAALRRLPSGEEITWVMPGAPSVDEEARGKLATPPADVRREVRSLCDARGLKLE